MYADRAGKFLSLSSCDKDETPQAAELGSITGVVVDEGGQAVADVNVTVASLNEEDISLTHRG